jgi:hypothetical protein
VNILVIVGNEELEAVGALDVLSAYVFGANVVEGGLFRRKTFSTDAARGLLRFRVRFDEPVDLVVVEIAERA